MLKLITINQKILILLFCLVMATSGFAKAQLPINEKAYADSLNQAYLRLNNDSARARTSFLLSHYWSVKNDTEQATKYFMQGRKLAKDHPYVQAISYFFEADLYLTLDTVKSWKAIHTGNRLLSAYKIKEAYTFRSKLWYNAAIMEQDADHVKTVVNILLNKVIPLVKKSSDKSALAKYYSQTGVIFMNTGQYERAAIYYNLCIGLQQYISAKSTILLRTYVLAASNYLYLHHVAQAKKLLDKAKAILAPFPKSRSLPDYYFTEGNYYEETSRYELALQSYEKGITLSRELKQDYMLETLVMQKYSALSHLKKYPEAKALLDSMAKATEYMAISNNRLQLYNEMAKTNEHLGLMKDAYQWLRRYSALNDSLQKSKLDTDIGEMELKFRNAENKQKISELSSANEKVKLTAKNSRLASWLLGAIALFLLFALLAGYYIYSAKQKLSIQKDLNVQQELKNIHQEQQIRIAQAMMQGQEEERARVARDLHDGLGGTLAVVKMNLSGYGLKHKIGQTPDFNAIITQLDHSVNELRGIARNMMPASLLRFGLETSIKDLCESFLSDHLQIDFQFFGSSKDILIQEQIAIYRIVQELLSNTLRHARATSVLLQCSRNEDTFLITIEDNGIGFNPNVPAEKPGMGFQNIKTRVDYLNGRMEIISAENDKGTTINIEINVTV
ncbi:Signal transduction histidine kinase [Pedobacter westerhofensis]|uniref:histidine kinase n=1 Tax=Pedobacter westerhofensis TaxID=425512 RepID=A0A521EA82_9SPHI|nr:ATP-binding protein [Pedobacter westerhofensis]SMO80834.1 Signal transduction histidine kinase [Pedobacter westerhofensis]